MRRKRGRSKYKKLNIKRRVSKRKKAKRMFRYKSTRGGIRL